MNHMNLEMTSRYEKGPVNCSISIASQCHNIYQVIHESYQSDTTSHYEKGLVHIRNKVASSEDLYVVASYFSRIHNISYPYQTKKILWMEKDNASTKFVLY